MKIILDYDALQPHVTLTQNGVAGSEVYGPLNSVRDYPMQSWLCRRGAWPGLEKVLSDIARGRKLEITFIGRELDYEDVCNALTGMQGMELCYQRGHELIDLGAAELKALQNVISDMPNAALKEQLQALADIRMPDEAVRIDSEEQYRENESSLLKSRTVMVMRPEVFRGIREELTAGLREHFMRPAESIAVLTRTPQEKNMLADEWAAIGITVCTEDDPLIGRLIEKYSRPELMKVREAVYGQIGEFFFGLEGRNEQLKSENRQMREMNMNMEMSEEQTARYDENLREMRWYSKHQPQIAALNREMTGRLSEKTVLRLL